MIRTRRRLWICSALLIVLLVFIWGNSLLPGVISKMISNWVNVLIPFLFGGEGNAAGGDDTLLRKFAHFSEFCALGMCLTWLLSMLQKHMGLPLLYGFLAACVDETIQAFVPGRNPSPVDVAIDTSGVCTGILLLLLGYQIYKKKKSKYILEEN